MKIAAIASVCFLCMGMCVTAQDHQQPVIACNLKAISSREHPRYNDLIKQLRSAVQKRDELATGYMYTVDGRRIGLKDIAEWITMERLCCPFLAFQLSVGSDHGDFTLALTGPEGVKALLGEEFPIRP
jgi:hypothetical protein